MENAQLKIIFERTLRNIAHEVRNPLTVIKGYSQLFTSRHEGDDEYAAVVATQCERIESAFSSLYEAFHSQQAVKTGFSPGKIIYESAQKASCPVVLCVNEQTIEAGALSFQRILSILFEGVCLETSPQVSLHVYSKEDDPLTFMFQYSSLLFQGEAELLCYPFGAKHVFSDPSSLFRVFMIAANEMWPFSCTSPSGNTLLLSLSLS